MDKTIQKLTLNQELLLQRSEIQSERSISNRFYFDYNATSPLSNKVIDFIKSGDFLFGNPSSLHQTGKKSRKFINETSDFLFKTFLLDPKDFNLVYHSGATEGINTFFKGIAFKFFKEKKVVSFFFSTVDHACVVELKDDLEALGHKVFFFEVDHDGVFASEVLIEKINLEKSLGRESYVNFTYINNETGVVWPLKLAETIKEKSGAYVHVDAVQLVGKIANWNYLSSKLDSYTFSGHKFGALKSSGFSFIRKDLKFTPLLVGGNQQIGLRAGTENALGIYSLKLSLEDIKEHFSATELMSAKKELESKLVKLMGTKGEVVAIDSQERNLNTIFIVLFGLKAETISAKFDLLGVDISTGSACSSGVIKENRILMGMGYSFEDSRSSLRFSFSPLMNKTDSKIYFEKIESILKNILK
ncbi:MAG: aminotransferase class V-fold PLP-dependent enzyme [Bacteriovorax sp.]|nr:aminotransferase class V-fold PLP-dependent enzyme [Bacteriovorax sp.]